MPSSTNWLPLKKFEAPLNRFESPRKNWAWPTPTKRTATAKESGTGGLMTMHVWIWCHFKNDWTDEVVLARNTKHFRRGDTSSVRPTARYCCRCAFPVVVVVGLSHALDLCPFQPSIQSPLAGQQAQMHSSSSHLSSPLRVNKTSVVAAVAAVVGVSGGGVALARLNTVH